MNVTVSDINDLRKGLVVSLTAAEVAEEEKAVLKEVQKQARVPGFRAGKAPLPMLRTRFRKEVREQLGRKVMDRAYRGAVEEKGLEVYDVVDVKGLEEMDPSTDVTLDITIDLVPSFDLPAYKELPTQVPSADVSDEEVDASVERIRRERADFSVVERAAAEGDYVKLSYTGQIGEQAVSELLGDEPSNKVWAQVENGWEEVGTDEAKEYGVPAIIDALAGHVAGDHFSVEASFADDFKIEALRGQTATYAVTVHEVRERVLPPLDEDFLKSIGVESVEDLKGQLLDQLENRKKREVVEQQRRQIIDQLLAGVDFPVPVSAVESETQNVMGRIMVENMQRGVPEDDFEKNKEALYAQSAQIAERDVKLQFILTRVAKEEEITVGQGDLQQAIMAMASQQRRAPEELIKELQKDRGRVAHLQRQVLFGKTLDFLVKQAKVEVESAAASADA